MELETGKWDKLQRTDPALMGAASGSCLIMSPNDPAHNATNYALYIGGTNFPWHKASRTCSLLTLPKNCKVSKFQQRSLLQLPVKVYGHACAFDESANKVYIFGGISKEIEEYDDEMGLEWSNGLLSINLTSLKVELVEPV